jgi:hypothetical protein
MASRVVRRASGRTRQGCGGVVAGLLVFVLAIVLGLTVSPWWFLLALLPILVTAWDAYDG